MSAIRHCSCGNAIKRRIDTACWICRVKANSCRSCLAPHDEINPQTGRHFTRCGGCRMRMNDLAASRKGREPLRKRGAAVPVIVPHVSASIYAHYDPFAARFRWASVIQRTSPVMGSGA